MCTLTHNAQALLSVLAGATLLGYALHRLLKYEKENDFD